MKPNFALTLSFDGIGLLHRISGGWHLVGDVALDAADLAGELALLRRKAVALDSAGLRSKLVIPNDQIRYLKLPAPAKGSDIGSHVARMLDGATPYAVADLRFDWIVVGTDLHIAAVARETLTEAEVFATEHEFCPVSFVAIPEDGSFPGEPFFSLTEAADSLIAPGDRLLRDTHPIRILGRATPQPAAPQPDAPQPAAAPVQNAPDDALPEVMPEVIPEVIPEVMPEAIPATSLSDAPAVVNAATLAQPDAAQPAPEQQDDAAPLPAFSTRRAKDTDLDTDPDAAPDAAPQIAALATAPDIPAAARSIAASRITITPDQAAARQAPTPDPSLRPAAFRSVPASPATDSISLANRVSLLLARVTAITSVIPRSAALTSRLRLPAFASPKPAGSPTPASTTKAIRGKPRFLGLILTGALLVFMAAVAAWSSIYTESGFSSFFGARDSATATRPDMPPPEDAPENAAEDAPQVDLVRLQDGQTLSDLGDDLLPPAATDAATEAAADPLTAPQPDTATAPPTAEQALTSYAATGIWQIAPDQPAPAMPGTLDDLYLASIDTRLQNFDAVALPEGRAPTDQRPPAQSSPAAPGTTFDLDPRGLVTATPEGALTAEGVTVFAGRPPVTPEGMPTRFARTPGVDPDPEAATEAEQAQAQALASLRPRLRPDTLIESNERAQLGGLSRNELAEVRPRPRPATLAAVALALREAAPLVDTTPDAEAAADEADAADSATAQAIASSLKPLARPRDLTTTDNSSPAPQQQVAAAATLSAPRNAAPQIPSSASVAQQATVRGAINLRNVNLIGVYGQPSNRRALVRLSNGRYQKVQVGDRLDGGQVRAIGESELSYTKGNRAIVLTMPRG
jgi:hypothetical protein